MPSLPIFSYLDSTHKNESNCVYYMVVSNQHLSTKISFSQYVFKCFFFNVGYVFKYLVCLNQRKSKTSSDKTCRDLISMWEGVDYLFVDEVSMIGCHLMLKI